MKNLISYSKHTLSTLFLFFAFLMIAEAQDYSQVRREQGLIMQRIDTTNVGMINFFHREEDEADPTDDYDFMFMRATKDNQNNNCVLTQDGLLLISNPDLCHRVNLPPDLPSDVKLFVNGDVAKSTGDATWSIVSDQRLKKNINPLRNSLNLLQEVEFVEFEYNGLAKTPTNKKYFGVLAQQVGQVLPSTVNTFSKQLRPLDKKNTELLMFNPNDLIYTGLNAVKELAEIDQEQHEYLLDELEKERNTNEVLEDRIDELEGKLEQLIASLQESNTQSISLRSHKTEGKLYPNIPNPLSQYTLIQYELSQITNDASILIQDMYGKIIKNIVLPNHVKSGSIEFDAMQTDLTSGTYVYTLMINGQAIDSQKMVFIAK